MFPHLVKKYVSLELSLARKKFSRATAPWDPKRNCSYCFNCYIEGRAGLKDMLVGWKIILEHSVSWSFLERKYDSGKEKAFGEQLKIKTPSENDIVFALVMSLQNIKSPECCHQMVIDFSATNLLISWPKKQAFILKKRFQRGQFKSCYCPFSFLLLFPL